MSKKKLKVNREFLKLTNFKPADYNGNMDWYIRKIYRRNKDRVDRFAEIIGAEGNEFKAFKRAIQGEIQARYNTKTPASDINLNKYSKRTIDTALAQLSRRRVFTEEVAQKKINLLSALQHTKYSAEGSHKSALSFVKKKLGIKTFDKNSLNMIEHIANNTYVIYNKLGQERYKIDLTNSPYSIDITDLATGKTITYYLKTQEESPYIVNSSEVDIF